MPDNNWVQQQAAAETRQKVFEAVSALIEETGVSPTVPEIAKKTGLGQNTIKRHVDALVDEGRLGRTPGQHRSLRVLE